MQSAGHHALILLPVRPASVSKASRGAIVVAVSVSFLSYVFDILHPAFWEAGLGDWLDPYFINYLLEHWYHVVCGFTDPSSPPMFFPAAKTLGYSHALVLYAPFYVPLRLLFHPFQAYSLALFAVIETGALCLYVIFRRFLNLSFVESLLLTVFFLTSQNVVNGTVGVWSQRASVFLIPPIALLLAFSRRRQENRARLVLAAIAGLLATLLFAHDFYTAQFALLFAMFALAAVVAIEKGPALADALWSQQSAAAKVAMVTAVVSAAWAVSLVISGGGAIRVLGIRITSRDWHRPALLGVASALVLGVVLGRQRRTMADRVVLPVARSWAFAVVAGAVIGSAVFLWIYLPSYREHRSFPEQDLLHAMTIRNSSRWSSPWDAFHQLRVYGTLRTFELVFLLGVMSWIPRFAIDRRTRLYALWAMAVSAVVLLIPLDVDGISIWLMVFRKLPGFAVIRDPTRIIYLYELAAIFAVGLFLTRIRRQPMFRIPVTLLLLFFIVTDHHTDVFQYARPRADYRRWVESPIAIDPACRSFFIKGASAAYASRSSNMWALYSIDAMFVSLDHHLPTLNGYSAWVPDGWRLFNPQEPGYDHAVHEWIQRHQLENVCELDMDARAISVVSTR
jgi:hypothetical protein